MSENTRHNKRRRRQPLRNLFNKWVRVGTLSVVVLASCAMLVLVLVREWSGDTLLPAVERAGRTKPNATAAPVHVALVLDGPFSAYFAGEMLAAKGQTKSADGLVFDLSSRPDRADFVAEVARDGAIGVTSGHKFLLARWRGTPVVAFAASFLDTPTVVLAFERSGIRMPRDLIGKALGYQPGSEAAVIFDAMMAQLGLPRSQLDKVPVENGLAALEAGSVAALVAAVGRRPVPLGDDATRMNVIRPQDYGIHVPGLVYFASETLLRERPALLRQALRAMIAGWHQVYADVPAAAAAVAAFDPTRLSVPAVDFALREQRDLVRPVGSRIADFDQSRWDTLRDILLYAKLGNETGSLSQAVTYDVLRDVYREAPDALFPASDRAGTN